MASDGKDFVSQIIKVIIAMYDIRTSTTNIYHMRGPVHVGNISYIQIASYFFFCTEDNRTALSKLMVENWQCKVLNYGGPKGRDMR